MRLGYLPRWCSVLLLGSALLASTAASASAGWWHHRRAYCPTCGGAPTSSTYGTYYAASSPQALSTVQTVALQAVPSDYVYRTVRFEALPAAAPLELRVTTAANNQASNDTATTQSLISDDLLKRVLDRVVERVLDDFLRRPGTGGTTPPTGDCATQLEKLRQELADCKAGKTSPAAGSGIIELPLAANGADGQVPLTSRAELLRAAAAQIRQQRDAELVRLKREIETLESIQKDFQ